MILLIHIINQLFCFEIHENIKCDGGVKSFARQIHPKKKKQDLEVWGLARGGAGVGSTGSIRFEP